MAVRGLDLFRERFAANRDSFVLIGGAACELWLAEQNLEFRATKDLDIVLILERLSPGFVRDFWRFIEEGRYEIRWRNEGGPPVLYRFEKPADARFPLKIEFFCREAVPLEVGPDQRIVPVRMEDTRSLSAILLNDDYYRYLLDHCRITREIQSANASALIPLKARAWLDLSRRQADGEPVDDGDVKKHRNDVFRLAATLPGISGPPPPACIAADLNVFLDQFPLDHAEWDGIRHSIRNTIRGPIEPAKLVDAIRGYYRLPNGKVPPHSRLADWQAVRRDSGRA